MRDLRGQFAGVRLPTLRKDRDMLEADLDYRPNYVEVMWMVRQYLAEHNAEIARRIKQPREKRG